MSSMDGFFKAKKTGITANEASKSDKSRPEGDTKVRKYRNYYDINGTITTAQTTDPNDQDNANYNQEQIFVSLERNAETLYVTNDGKDTLFVIVSHEGGQNFARERPIYPGEMKTIYNVYEIRLRSPTQGLPYRVSEYRLYALCCPIAIKSYQDILDNVIITSSQSNTSAAIDVRGYNYMTITSKATMNGAATADPAMTVEVITSLGPLRDNAAYDNTGVYSYVTAISMALSAGNTKQKTSNLIDLRGINYIEIVTTNKDSGQSLTAVYVDLTLVH